MPFEAVDPSELCQKLLLLSELSSPALAIAVPQYDQRAFLNEFKASFEARSLFPLVIAEPPQPSLESFSSVLQVAQNFTVCIGFDAWPDDEFKRLDANRSWLLSFQILLFVFAEPTLDRFLTNCPHVSSIVGAATYSIHQADLDLSDSDREIRLSRLRRKFSLSDTEFVAQAANGNFRGDPYANEWLILLDRGDLINAPLG